jgi:putative hydrolase of the HAD superfamily
MKRASPFEGIRLALFDLDGTLRKIRPSSLEALVSYGADLGLKFDEEARRSAIRWSHKYWSTNEQVRHDLDRFGREAFLGNYLALVMKALGVDGAEHKDTVSQVVTRFQEEFAPEPYLEPGAKEVLWNLREAGLVVGLVSNRDEPLTGLAIELGIMTHFNFTLAAGQVNCWKPDAGIFQQALKMGGGVPSEETVYVGDNYYTDVVGARGVGIRAVLLDEEGAFSGKQEEECLVISKLSELKDWVPKAPIDT